MVSNTPCSNGINSRRYAQEATAAVNAANAKAATIADQMHAANEQNGKFRDLNSRFISELRAARQATG